ncbi:Zn(II)2Cys6 transcription factor domain-containing protein [Aspergillus lucknowensis]|uniref:Zn(2)-C6 fungal-type domain-containing protein n=1 Tax=Aspergillus lucknowensis TaxID=176173 RepID=A0ABR4LK30_9EURO
MPPMASSIPSAKRRKVTSRVKSGCRTCKIRRVKCDEQKPSCSQCVQSGRACEGYGIWEVSPSIRPPTPNQRLLSLIYPPRTLPNLDLDEKLYLHRFRNQLAEKLALPFGCHFWTSLVLQLSLSEPAVLHASIALASAYEANVPSHSRATFLRNAPATSFLLRQYNRAIRALTSSVSSSSVSSDDTASLRVAVVSCVLFICLEIFRGNLNAMQAHFGSGVKLLCQLQRRQPQLPPTSGTVLVAQDPECLDDHLVDVFTRINLQFIMLGYSAQQKGTFVSPFQYGRRFHIPRQFRSGREARQYSNTILLAVIYLIKDIEATTLTTGTHPPPPSLAAFEKQKALQVALAEWIDAYEHSVEFLVSTSPQEDIGLLMLRIYADVCTILVATCFSIKETAYDAHIFVFESIMKRYRDSISEKRNPAHSSKNKDSAGSSPCEPRFTLDIGFFPPLYFTALKCRNQTVRHEALSILRKFRSLEGPWTGSMLARVAGHVVNLEEQHFVKALLPAGTSKPTTTPTAAVTPGLSPQVVLPEFCRFHCVEWHLPSGCDGNSNCAFLTLRRFRHELGKVGDWCITQCTVDLSLGFEDKE